MARDGMTGPASGMDALAEGGAAEADVEAASAAAAIPPAFVAQSLREYATAWVLRVRNGDSGQLPVVLALAAIVIAFQVWTHGLFLTAGNLVNLFIESMVFMTLAMAEVFVLLLGEIDLSVGYVLAVGAVIAGRLVQKPGPDLPWWLAIIGALVCCAAIGAVWGALVSRLRLPSFIVTLAGLLIMWGLMLVLLPAQGLSVASPILHNQHVIYEIVNGNIAPLAGWIILAVVVALFGAAHWSSMARRRRSGLAAAPPSVTIMKIALSTAVGVAVVAICNVNRGVANATVEGVPWAVPIVLGVLLVWSVLLQRTPFGRYVYAIGGNPESARRAGINLATVRLLGFVFCSLTAGIAGLLYLSWQGGASSSVDGGSLVLYAVAAAVVGGTSLYGGRGRAVHGILGGLVIGAIYNGLYLEGIPIQWQLIATGLVLLAAILVDTFSRRGAMTGSVTRI